jgi:uncharacterized membrane protein
MASSKARSRNRSGATKGRPAASARAAAPGVHATPTSGGKLGNGGKPGSGAKAAGAVRTVDATGSAAEQEAKLARRSGGPADQAEPEAAQASGPPLWLQLTTLGLALLGLAIASYEWYAVWNGGHLAGCPTGKGGTFDCAAVLNSSQSKVFGIFDVAILGTFFYVFLVAIMTPWAWRMERLNIGRLHLSVGWIRLAAMVTGMGFVMYLIYAELYQIGQVCEYCSGVHIVTFVLFCFTLVSAAIWGLRRGEAG